MMTVAALRRGLTDRELDRVTRAQRETDLVSALRAIIDRLADVSLLFEASDRQRDEISQRAAKMFMVAQASTQDSNLSKLHLAAGDRRARVRAAARLSREGHWTPPNVIGSLIGKTALPFLCRGKKTEKMILSDGTEIARALLVAAREVIVPGITDAQERLLDSADAAMRNEVYGAGVWDVTVRPLISEFARNARSAGASRAASALRALAAAVQLRGSALQERASSDDEIAFQLGSAAAILLSAPVASSPSITRAALAGLAGSMTEMNAVRSSMWDGSDPDSTRLLGAAAAFSVFGKGSVDVPLLVTGVEAAVDGEEIVFPRLALRLRLPEGWSERFAHLSAQAAAEILDDIAVDPRVDETARLSAEVLSDALKRHADPVHVSFADALGLPDAEFRAAALHPGARVFSAVPRGKYRATAVCKGKHGRKVRCRAVADHDGALVGYLAFDPFSRELAGRPLYAAYALDGNRYGYAFADASPVIRRGEPEQGFTTAPISIST